MNSFFAQPMPLADGSFPNVTRLGPTCKAMHHSLILGIAGLLALTPGRTRGLLKQPNNQR